MALRGHNSYGKASAAESHRLRILLRTTPLSTCDLGKVAVAIKEAGFTSEDEVALLDALAEGIGVAQPCSAGPKSSTQDFTELLKYLTPEVLKSLRNGGLTDLMDHLAKLGLRHPSEPTSQIILILVLHETEGLQKALDMAAETKLDFGRTLKAMFKTRAKLLTAPASHVNVLPSVPAKFREQHPVLWAAAFQDAEPSGEPIQEAALAQLRRSCRMRAVKGGPMQLNLNTAGSSSIALPPQLMQFGQQLCGQMAFMQAELSALKGSQKKIVSAPLCSVPPPPLALQRPPAPTAPLALADAPRTDASQVTREPAVAPPSDAPQPPMEAAKAEPLSTSPAAAVVDAITKDIRSAIGKAKGKTKGELGAKAKGKAKSKTKGPAKAKPKVKGKLLMGCSRCRGSPKGCTTCRDPLWKGKRWQKE